MLALAAAPAPAQARTAQGGAIDDRIVGSAASDRLFGGGGADRLSGGAGDDRLVGEAGDDTLAGGRGADRLLGGGGADRLAGGPDADHLVGGAGPDRLTGGGGQDRLVGGAGADRLNARDGDSDEVMCGAGDDTVVADAEDEVGLDCERVSYGAAGRTQQTPFPPGEAWPTADGWRLEVVGVDTDATDVVLAESDANSSPRPGDVFTMVRVRAVRAGSEAGSFDAGVRVRAVAPGSAVVYSSFEDSCGLTPDAVPDDTVEPGEALEGNVCWSVPEEAAPELVLVDSPLTESTQRFFALR